MQRIGADYALGLLRYLAARVGRQQLGAYWGVGNIPERIGAALKGAALDKALYHPAYQRLGDSGVHAVHAHVVAVVGAPAEGGFAQVARADDYAADLARKIHEHLRALTSLRILIGQVKLLGVVAYIGEMLHTGSFYIYLLNGDAERFHKRKGVAIGSVRRAEAGHSDAYHVGSGSAQLLDRLHAHEQRKGRVKPARNTDNGAAIRLDKAFFEACDLHFKYGKASLGAVLLGVGHKGQLAYLIV